MGDKVENGGEDDFNDHEHEDGDYDHDNDDDGDDA